MICKRDQLRELWWWSTLLLVQADLSQVNLGVATSFHQLFRTLGGTIGVGICGGVVITGLLDNLQENAPQTGVL